MMKIRFESLLGKGGLSLVAQLVKNPPAMHETWLPSLGREDPLEKGTATHSSGLSWRIPWNCQESDGTDRLSHSHTHSHWERCPDMFLLKSKNERVSHSAVSDSLPPHGL